MCCIHFFYIFSSCFCWFFLLLLEYFLHFFLVFNYFFCCLFAIYSFFQVVSCRYFVFECCWSLMASTVRVSRGFCKKMFFFLLLQFFVFILFALRLTCLVLFQNFFKFILFVGWLSCLLSVGLCLMTQIENIFYW